MVAVVSDTLRVSFPRTVRNKTRACQISMVKAQSLREEEEGRWSNMVDASRSVLRKRIDEVQTKENLERCWRSGEFGWNYQSSHQSSQHYQFRKRRREAAELSEMAVLVVTTFSLAVVAGTACLVLASALINLL